MTTPEVVIQLPDLATVDTLPAAQLPGVLSQLAALQARVAARLATEVVGGDDELLTAPEAAEMLGMSVDWVYRNASHLPFTRRIGPRTLKFSKAGIRRYLAARGC